MRNLSRASIIVIGLALGCSLAACASTSTSESTGAYVDDASITTKVKAAILDDASLKVLEIHVVTYQSVVQLSGFVDSPATVSHAGTVAGRVAGVKSVRNDLIVR
ncbi:MAG TPA: BON domain-containing protein [Alphaproteobacteria bacterium]|nr:BON domain-containing protein [Alphaproteobacteria bacterium]